MPEDSRQFDSQQRRSFWENHIEQWQKSGLSQAAYCRSHQPTALNKPQSMPRAKGPLLKRYPVLG